MTAELRRVATNLRSAGIEIEFRRRGVERLVRIVRKKERAIWEDAQKDA